MSRKLGTYHILSFDSDRHEIYFDYVVRYEIGDSTQEIQWSNDTLTINGIERASIGKTPHPDNVLVYYSGHNNAISKKLQKYEERFRRKIKGANIEDSRELIGIGADYNELLLAIMLTLNNDNKAYEFVKNKLGIRELGLTKPGTQELTEPVLRIELKRPEYAKGSQSSKYNIENNDETDRYWQPIGITKDFLDKIQLCINQAPGGLTLSNGYFSADDKYILYLDISKVNEIFGDLSSLELFNLFDNLKTLGMLSSIYVPFALNIGEHGAISQFSDGQFQSVYIYAITELFKERECITFLDEPDAFLHPEWQFEFLKQLADISEEATNTNHILMTSHSAATLCNVEQSTISQMKFIDGQIKCEQTEKRVVINDLSNSFIQYSEDESKLLIDNVIRTSLRPVLFVEGPSDVNVLNTAYEKLYDGEDIPILIQDAFNRGFIRTLLARHEIYQDYPNKIFFGLFDFDDAYEDWRDLNGAIEIDNIEQGLCKKLTDKDAYTFLLPIPNNDIRNQVWDENSPIEKVKPGAHFCIEHAFWGVDGLEEWFKVHDKSGKIIFKGEKHKVKFSKNIIPTLPAEHFEVFRPMFDFIRNKVEQHMALAKAS